MMTPSLPTPAGDPASLPTAGTPFASSAPASHSGFTFHDFLSIINPLQHLPVIGTIYRAITGEHIGPVEKIAGDTLYGGLWGAVSSIADVALEQITGKSAEDTVLGWLKGSSDTEVVHIPNKVCVGIPRACCSQRICRWDW